MSVLSSKLIAINIVDVADGSLLASDIAGSRQDKDGRLRLLENQVDELKKWKASMLPKPVTASIEELESPSSAESVSSVHSRDFDGSELSSSLLLSPKIHPEQVEINPELQKSLKHPGPLKPTAEITTRIMSIIESYGQNEENSSGIGWLGYSTFEPRVRKAVDNKVHVPLVLPAFPWKSVNKVEKVLGALPDLGEELALARLNNLCEDIQAIYPPGAKVTITSDGLVYNDLLGISDEEVFHYGAALRRIAEEREYEHLGFIRIMNLLGLTDKAHMTKEEYLESVGNIREALVEKYLDPTFIATEAIEQDRDISLTYCGYLKFLAKDLRHSPITAGIVGKNEYKRIVKQVAQDMITRGKAFARAIEVHLPDYVRLSIHRSTGLTKLAFPLVPQPNHFSMTPWHCCIAVTSKGEFRTAHKTSLVDSYDVIEQNGRPFYFRDRSDMWNWEGVEFFFSYPKTVTVRAKAVEGQEAPKLGKEEMKKLNALGKAFSPVITIGFVA